MRSGAASGGGAARSSRRGAGRTCSTSSTRTSGRALATSFIPASVSAHATTSDQISTQSTPSGTRHVCASGAALPGAADAASVAAAAGPGAQQRGLHPACGLGPTPEFSARLFARARGGIAGGDLVGLRWHLGAERGAEAAGPQGGANAEARPHDRAQTWLSVLLTAKPAQRSRTLASSARIPPPLCAFNMAEMFRSVNSPAGCAAGGTRPGALRARR